MKTAVLATVSGLFLAASTLALPATNSTNPEASLEQWQGAFHVKQDMQCMTDNTAIIVGNLVTGNEQDSPGIIDEATKRCQDDAVRLSSRTDCQPEKLETECYFPIWMEYSKCVGNSPSTSKKGTGCPKDPNGKPEKVKGQKAKPEEAKPEEAKPEEAKPQEADEAREA
ncbi:hypothetical protein MGU_07610 [Metarhizium guizhouense ARSEF 977]|uniref:Uncharacterized protein n=1 Tax=Metarhizium guizhouense (strain ARSEF 977) TaxID=1276136 RepID=A0A0B4GRD4_METGA|nr:hypothetical protein MGU_07610 [Metarhizium guizhouense ARSEF 977]